MSDDESESSSVQERPLNPGEETLRFVDMEDLKVAMARNPMVRWDGRDMDSLLAQIPLARMGQVRYDLSTQ